MLQARVEDEEFVAVVVALNEEVKQQVHNVMASHGIVDKDAWYLLCIMADELLADMYGVVA